MPRWATLPALPAGAPSPTVRPTTIAAALPRFNGWFKYVKQASANTCDAYQRTLTEFSRFADEVGLQELAAMTPQAIEMYLSYGRQGGETDRPRRTASSTRSGRSLTIWCASAWSRRIRR
jgi:site-specific recombinase XerD